MRLPEHSSVAAAGLAADGSTSAGHGGAAAGTLLDRGGWTRRKLLGSHGPETGASVKEQTSPRLDSPLTARTRQGTVGRLPAHYAIAAAGRAAPPTTD